MMIIALKLLPNVETSAILTLKFTPKKLGLGSQYRHTHDLAEDYAC